MKELSSEYLKDLDSQSVAEEEAVEEAEQITNNAAE